MKMKYQKIFNTKEEWMSEGRKNTQMTYKKIKKQVSKVDKKQFPATCCLKDTHFKRQIKIMKIKRTKKYIPGKQQKRYHGYVNIKQKKLKDKSCY